MLQHHEAERLQQIADQNISKLTRDQCVELDAYIKEYALREFKLTLKRLKTNKTLTSFVYNTVRAHYGSIEVDRLLREFRCYPQFCR